MLGTAWGSSCLDHVARIERDGRVLMRIRNRLIDNHGQSYFNFEDAHGSTVPAAANSPHPQAGNVNDLFDSALALEDFGKLAEAARAYQRAIECFPTDSLFYFNLGNVLCKLEQVAKSAASYEQTVERDPRFAEAWNNLRNVCANLVRTDESMDTLRNAIQLVPTYPGAHYNLAEVVKKVGRVSESAHYYTYCPSTIQYDQSFADGPGVRDARNP